MPKDKSGKTPQSKKNQTKPKKKKVDYKGVSKTKSAIQKRKELLDSY